MKHALSKSVCVLLLLGAGCSGSGQYLKVTSAYADTATASLATFAGATDLSASLCHSRARFEYLFRRLNGPITQDQEVITLATFEGVFRYPMSSESPTGLTWSQHCATLAKADGIVRAAMDGLSAYSQALATLSNGDYSGSDLKALVANASDLAAKLGAPTKTTAVAKSLVDPLSRLAGGLLRSYAKSELANVVAQSEPDVTLIFEGIERYFQAVDMGRRDAASSLNNVLMLADNRLNQVKFRAGAAGRDEQPVAPVSTPVDILALSDLATRWTSELADANSTLSSMHGALTKLKEAHRKLIAAKGRDDAPELKALLGDLVTLLNDIQRVRKALAGKEV